MKRRVIFLFCILTLVSIFTACGTEVDSSVSPTPILSKTKTPIPTNTSTLTLTPTGILTPTITPTPTATPLPYFLAASREEVLVIVAEFEDRSDGTGADLNIASSIYERIVENLPDEAKHIRVELYPQPIKDAKEARRLLDTYNALLLVSGWYDLSGGEGDIEINAEKLVGDAAEPPKVYVSVPVSLLIGFVGEPLEQDAFLSLVSLGLISYHEAAFQEAVVYFSEIIDNLGNRSNEAFSLAKLYYWRGRSLFELERYDAALTDFNKAIALDPKFAAAYESRGEVYWALLQYKLADADDDRAIEIAIVDYSEAIEHDPEDADNYFYRGYAYLNVHKSQEAMLDFNTAIELDPNYAYAYIYRGSTYEQLGQDEQALAEYSKAIELEPEGVSFYYWRAGVYIDLKQYGQAYADLDKSIELDPEVWIPYYLYGRAYQNLRQYEKAIDYFTIAIEKSPGESAFLYRTRGDVYFDLEQYEVAIADLTKAIAVDPDDYWAYYLRGIVYRKIGQNELAIVDFKKVIAVYPDQFPYTDAYCYLAEIYQDMGRDDLSTKYYDMGVAQTDDYFWCYSLSPEARSLTEAP